MSLESTLYDTLKVLVAERVYPTVIPASGSDKPYIVWQQVGGTAVNYLEGGAVGIRIPRIQVNVWDTTPGGAIALARQVEDAIRATPALQPEVLGDFVSLYDEDTKLYGTSQDFRLVA